MNRQTLIDQVKAEYARLADMESLEHVVGQIGDLTAEAYYEKLLNEVLAGIDAGRFDDFSCGHDIVEAVASGHHKWGISM